MNCSSMAWLRYVCGKLESRYRYSKDVVYNNYPWPEPTDAQRERIDVLAQGILDARNNHPTSTLADLYHPTTMPRDLRRAMKPWTKPWTNAIEKNRLRRSGSV